MKFHQLNRVLHRWASVIVAAPLILVIITGILLQLKKESDWIQPPTQRGSSSVPSLSFERILEIVRTVPEAGVQSWEDIDRLDVRPSRGMLKVRVGNRWELQLDTKTGKILQVAYRRSDLIESLHDGTFFHDRANLWVFLHSAVVLLGLWMTGLFLFILPYQTKWRRRRRAKAM